MTDEELRDSLTWLKDHREELKLSDETIKRIDSLLNWILFDDLVNRIACIIHEAEKGTYNEKV